MANSKTSTGFDLIIGSLLNEGWERAKVPFRRDYMTCDKCQSQALDVWELERRLKAFGQTIVQHCTAIVCTNCLHEALIQAHQSKSSKPKTRRFSRENKLKLTQFLSKLTDDELKKFLK